MYTIIFLFSILTTSLLANPLDTNWVGTGHLKKQYYSKPIALIITPDITNKISKPIKSDNKLVDQKVFSDSLIFTTIFDTFKKQLDVQGYSLEILPIVDSIAYDLPIKSFQHQNYLHLDSLFNSLKEYNIIIVYKLNLSAKTVPALRKSNSIFNAKFQFWDTTKRAQLFDISLTKTLSGTIPEDNLQIIIEPLIEDLIKNTSSNKQPKDSLP